MKEETKEETPEVNSHKNLIIKNFRTKFLASSVLAKIQAMDKSKELPVTMIDHMLGATKMASQDHMIILEDLGLKKKNSTITCENFLAWVKVTTPPGDDVNKIWTEKWDDASGYYYYLNSVTKESQWKKPEGFVSLAERAGGGTGSADGGANSSIVPNNPGLLPPPLDLDQIRPIILQSLPTPERLHDVFKDHAPSGKGMPRSVFFTFVSSIMKKAGFELTEKLFMLLWLSIEHEKMKGKEDEVGEQSLSRWLFDVAKEGEDSSNVAEDGMIEIDVPDDVKPGKRFSMVINGVVVHAKAPKRGQSRRISVNVNEELSNHMDL